MTKLSQYEDINAVLNKAKQSLSIIERKYNDSLHSKEIPADLLVEIKDFLGNLRSSLDYLRGKVSKYKFPICKTQMEFDNATTDLDNSIKLVIKKWQPFNGQQWIGWFNKLNNELKHVTLIPQKRIESIETRISRPQCGLVSWRSGVAFGSGVSVLGVPIDPQTQLPVPNDIVKTERITWVHFNFDNANIAELPSNISALPFLKQCF